MNRKSKIVIVGGGIGGLTTAIALNQLGFINIQIVERRAEAQSVGAGFVIWANACWVLNKLNLLNEVSVFGGRLKQMQRWSDQGDNLGAIEIDRIDNGIGYPSFAVSKTEFQLCLLKKVKESGIDFKASVKVTGIEDGDHEKAILRLDDNSVIHADIIIGADGRMNSIARKYIQGENQPVYQHYINWVGIIENNNSLAIENNVMDYWGCGERFGIVPISEKQVYWAGCKKLPLTSLNSEVSDKKELLKLFANWPAVITQIIEQTNDRDIKRIPVFDHNPNPDWFRNNVCLLGDAAHASLPTSGQGACQAIEDAWHLAKQLASFETLNESFEVYRKIRYEKTTTITLAGRDLAKSLFSTDKYYCEERNNKARSTDYNKVAEGIIGLWSKDLN